MRALLRRLSPGRTRKAAAARPGDNDYAAQDRRIIERVGPYTMTSPRRIEALIQAVRYCEHAQVPGAFAECGVWRGGSVLAMLLTLLEIGQTERDIYLYDTFEGMTEPTAEDTSSYEESAMDTWREFLSQGSQPWGSFFNRDVFNMDDVKAVLLATGYPPQRLHFVQGPVEQTVPQVLAEQLALLRLDTDWYASTRHELEHMYPRIATGGVLIIDDYGHWDGCRKAVDDYFAQPAVSPVLLQRIDYTGRLAIKSHSDG